MAKIFLLNQLLKLLGMKIKSISIVISAIYGYWICAECSFLGGTISWVQFPQGVRFTYRLTLERGSGPCGKHCSVHNLYRLGSLPPWLRPLSWNCTTGCTGNQMLHNVNYIVTSLSQNTSGWEQGENIFFHNFTGHGQYEITLDGLNWTVPGSGPGKLVTSVDLGLRNDTGSPRQPNSSPIAALQPLVGIRYNCTSKLQLPVEDPDGDSLRCRLATSSECGGACTSLPSSGFTVDEAACSLSISATPANGIHPNQNYRITMMVEDYPGYTIKVGNKIRSIRRAISKIPLQFTLRTISDASPCRGTGLSFTTPTVPDGFRFSYQGLSVGVFKYAVYLDMNNTSNAEFMVSAPAGMGHVLLPDDNNRTAVERAYFTMHPSPYNQSGDSMVCVWGRLHNGLTTTDKRCITSIMYDFNECRGSNPCKNNGTCVNLYRRWTCKCPHGFKPKDCSARVTCADFPCKFNGSCVDTGKSYTCHCQKGFSGLDCETKIQIINLVTSAGNVTSSSNTSATEQKHVHIRLNLQLTWRHAAIVCGILLPLMTLVLFIWLSCKQKYQKRNSKVTPLN